MINTGNKNLHGPPQNLASMRSRAFAILGSLSSYRSIGSIWIISLLSSAAAAAAPGSVLDMSLNIACHLKVIVTTAMNRISNRDSCIRPNACMSFSGNQNQVEEWKKGKERKKEQLNRKCVPSGQKGFAEGSAANLLWSSAGLVVHVNPRRIHCPISPPSLGRANDGRLFSAVLFVHKADLPRAFIDSHVYN